HLERLRIVVLRIALEHVLGVLLVADVLRAEHARAGRVDAWAEHVPDLDAVLVAQDVRGGRLRVTRGGHAVRQARQVLPDLPRVDLGYEPLRVVVGVHESGEQRGSGDVDDPRVRRDLDLPAGA